MCCLCTCDEREDPAVPRSPCVIGGRVLSIQIQRVNLFLSYSLSYKAGRGRLDHQIPHAVATYRKQKVEENGGMFAEVSMS